MKEYWVVVLVSALTSIVFEWKFKLDQYREGGPASFKPDQIPDGWRVKKYDYLQTVEENRIYWRIAD